MSMTEEKYWELVENGPDNYTRDQRILFWWVVMLLPRLAEGGVIMTPDPAPLTAEEIERVFLDLHGDQGEPYLGQSWSFSRNTVITQSSDGFTITLEQNGLVTTEKP